MALFQICPVCGSQQDIEPYDFCQTCGHEWSSAEIRSSTPVPRPTQYALDAAIQPPAEHVQNSDIIPAGEVDTQPRQ